MATNYYTVLGLTPGASSTEIKEAYRKLCFKYHPDKTDGDCSEQMKAIVKAYEVLSNNTSRKIYMDFLQSEAVNAALQHELGKMIYVCKKLIWALVIIIGALLVTGGVMLTKYVVGKFTAKPPVAEQVVSPSAAMDKDVKAFFDKQVQK